LADFRIDSKLVERNPFRLSSIMMLDERLKTIILVVFVVLTGILAGTAYSSYTNSSHLTKSSASTLPDQGCQTYSASTLPDLFGKQIDSVNQVTLNQSYTDAQLQKASAVVQNDGLIDSLTQNRTNVDYITFQKIQSGEVDLTGEFYTITTSTGYIQNGSSRVPIVANTVLVQYSLCGNTLYEVWIPEGIIVRVLFSPSTTTVNQFNQGNPTVVTIGEVDLTVNTTTWSVVSMATSSAPST
jgi:hypothetical protein